MPEPSHPDGCFLSISKTKKKKKKKTYRHVDIQTHKLTDGRTTGGRRADGPTTGGQRADDGRNKNGRIAIRDLVYGHRILEQKSNAVSTPLNGLSGLNCIRPYSAFGSRTRPG